MTTPVLEVRFTLDNKFWIKDMAENRMVLGPFHSQHIAESTARIIETLVKLDAEYPNA